MIWNSATPRLRIALTVAAAWMVISLAYALISGALMSEVRNSYVESDDAICQMETPLGEPERDLAIQTCHAAKWMNRPSSDLGLFVEGNGFWILVKWVFLFPITIILLAGFSDRAVQAAKMAGSAYLRWLKGAPKDNSR